MSKTMWVWSVTILKYEPTSNPGMEVGVVAGSAKEAGERARVWLGKMYGYRSGIVVKVVRGVEVFV